jgi:hypothetical protein
MFHVLVSVQVAVYPAPVALALQLDVHTLPFTVVLAHVASGNPALNGARVSAGAIAHSLAAAAKHPTRDTHMHRWHSVAEAIVLYWSGRVDWCLV